jgi:hypothetical protein
VTADRAMASIGRALALTLAMAALVACQPAATTPGGTGVPAQTGGSSLGPPATVGPPSSPTNPPSDSEPVVLDDALLDVLPESIDGIAVTESIDEAALALTDPALPMIATALDVGVAVDPASGNLATAHVVKLRPDAFDETTFQQWRSSYDEGACNASGGILGLAEATIDDRNVFITSCVAGLRTYHVWVEEQDLLVSASSIGEDRFGEKLMDNLRVPE